MAGPLELLSRRLPFVILIIFGVVCSTKASFVLPSANQTPRVLNTASQGDEMVSYTVHTEELTWDEARQRCVEDGGRLAVIDTLEKARLVGELKPYDCYVWVGITRSNPLEAWIKAHDGSPVSNVPWAPNQPSGSHNCLTVQGCNRGLGDEDCAARKGFVCEKPPEECSISSSTLLQEICQLVTPAASTCERNCTCADTIPTQTSEQNQITSLPDGYEQILNSSVAYKVFNGGRTTWIEAKELCEKEGARLALVENEDINKRLYKKSKYGLHVGIHRLFSEWVSLRDGSKLNNLPWGFNEPDMTKDCVFMTWWYGALVTESCRTAYGNYACEVPIPQKPVQTINVQSTWSTDRLQPKPR